MEEDDFYDRVNDYGDGKEDGGRHEGGFDKPCHTEKIGDSMSAETKILTDEQIDKLVLLRAGHNTKTLARLCRDTEQAILQSPEVVAMRKDADDTKRLDWLDNVAHCADWMEGEPTKRVIRACDGAEFTGASWREAIDAARRRIEGES